MAGDLTGGMESGMDISVACRSCGGRDLFVILSMGEMPLANSLLAAPGEGDREPRFPIDFALCRQCAQVQITQTVPPETLFRNYLYYSSFSSTMLRHAQAIAESLTVERSLGPKSLVVEIASNDGYLLKNFVEQGVPVLGIEPARNIAQSASERGIDTISEFFGVQLAESLASQGRRADVILANNVMAHMPDINGVAAGIKALLKPGGIFVMETPYVKDLVDHLEFDTIYHEHIFYHSVTSLEPLFRRHGLATVKVEHLPIHGGTLRVSAAHAGEAGDTAAVQAWLASEAAWAGNEAFYRGFSGRVANFGEELTGLLRGLKAEGKRIAGYGAAAKASTLVNYLGLDKRVIDFVADRSPYKQGLFMPGSRIPIRAPEDILTERPDYLIILAWNFAEEIMEQQAEFRKGGGKFIIPLPSLRIE